MKASHMDVQIVILHVIKLIYGYSGYYIKDFFNFLLVQ